MVKAKFCTIVGILIFFLFSIAWEKVEDCYLVCWLEKRGRVKEKNYLPENKWANKEFGHGRLSLNQNL